MYEFDPADRLNLAVFRIYPAAEIIFGHIVFAKISGPYAPGEIA
jgi:hypothetical protein